MWLTLLIHTLLMQILHACWVAQSCLTLCDPVDCSPPGSSVLGILQARILEWVAMPSSRDLPHPGLWCLLHWPGGWVGEGGVLYHQGPPGKPPLKAHTMLLPRFYQLTRVSFSSFSCCCFPHKDQPPGGFSSSDLDILLNSKATSLLLLSNTGVRSKVWQSLCLRHEI